MRTKLFFMLALPLVFAACSKSDKCGYTTTTAVASAAEISSLKTYLDANSLVYTQHASGVFYKVNVAGSGSTPGVCSDVTVKYVGSLTNGTTFENSNTNNPNGVSFTLGQLIAGWQIGIPLIRKGGSITLYIPPSLGYGSSSNGSIPANSNLIFTIELVNVQ
ncbi:MAG: FKBP-type peptidyl-prolyl cis-trans isomerase [Ferruginibacter sp.]|nr:FKBP-type peptidyl-prolyl cis-trans isomerase [Ferruginibacter sp.]